MKRNQYFLFTLFFILIFFNSLNSNGQDTRTTPTRQALAKQISAEDKAALIAIFKNVDPKLYRLEFGNGREVYGTKKITMTELEQVRKVRNPLDAKGMIVYNQRDDGVMETFAITNKTKGNELLTILGKEKYAKLNAILTKYGQ